MAALFHFSALYKSNEQEKMNVGGAELTISPFVNSNGASTVSCTCCHLRMASLLKLMPGNHAGRYFTKAQSRENLFTRSF